MWPEHLHILMIGDGDYREEFIENAQALEYQKGFIALAPSKMFTHTCESATFLLCLLFMKTIL